MERGTAGPSAGAHPPKARPRKPARRNDAVVALVTVGTALALAVVVLRAWRADLRAPMEYSGDAHYMLMSVKATLEGSYLVNPRLGAPFGQELYDFPFLNGEALHVAAIKILGAFSSDPALVLNLFFLATFPLVALSAFLVLRRVGLSAPVALVCSLLFTFLPYHFGRGEAHLFLSAYYSVPLGAWLVLRVLAGERLFGRRSGVGRWWSVFATRRSLATAAICVVIGTAGVYYAAFTLVLLAAAILLAVAVTRSARPLASGGAAVALILATIVVSFSPTLVYRVGHGVNPDVERTAWETEHLGVRLMQLVLPVQGHRLDPLAELRERYDATIPATEAASATLGLVATLGFLLLLAVILVSVLGRGSSSSAGGLYRRASVPALIALLIAMTGGFATGIAHVLTPWLHAWNRISVFIAFYSLLAVGLLLDRARASLAFRRAFPVLWPAVLGAVFVLGLLDQTTSAFIRPYESVAAAYESDARFVRRVERLLPRGTMVFQLPAVPFPELEQGGRTSSYDPARPYVHSERLRWSYGAMRGRPEDWATETRNFSAPLLVASVSAAGFRGLWLDRLGYWRDEDAKTFERELIAALGRDPLVSDDQRFLFFDLRPYGADLGRRHGTRIVDGLREATLRPVRFEWGADFPDVERQGAQAWRWAVRSSARLTVVNPLGRARQVELRSLVATGTAEPQRVRVRYPDGSSATVVTTPLGTPIRKVLRLRPGRNVILFSTSAPRAPGDSRSLYLRLIDPAVLDPARLPFERAPVPVA